MIDFETTPIRHESTSRIRRTTGGRARRGVVPALGLIVILALSGCGSSKKSSSSSSPGSSANTSAAATDSSASGSGGALTGDAADVKALYEKFFAPGNSTAEAESMLQGGAGFAAAIAAQAKSAVEQKISVQVTNVTLLSANKAAVTFTLLANGSPVLPNQSGWAVKDGGQWKVAATTFCGLIAMAGAPPAACSDPKATTLPS